MDDLREQLEAFLTDPQEGPVEVADLKRLPGGASRETWTFTAKTRDGERKLVLRRDPPGAPPSSSRAAEYELLRRAHAAGVAVPRVLHLAEGGELGAPGFLMEHVEGETIPRRILREGGLALARSKLAAQCGEVLANIHSVDVSGLPDFVAPSGNPALDTLDRFRGLLDALGEPHPAFELGLRWLERRAPADRRVTLVHGDFRNGNLIVGPEGLRAVLDWELAHLGDPFEDLGWLCTRSWRFGAPGEVGGFGDREDLYRSYEQTSGAPVDRGAVRWWEAMGSLKWGVMTVMQAFTHLQGHVPSHELAAIGRRTVECEYDVLTVIRSG